MKIKKIELKGFKRFTNVTIEDIPSTAKLIVLIGPNGSGKTSLFEAFKQFSSRYGGLRHDNDINYLSKGNAEFLNTWTENIKISFHDKNKLEQSEYRKAFYFRSAHRNEADFNVSSLQKMGSALESQSLMRLIDNDSKVSDNYHRIVSHSIEKLYSGENDTQTVKQLRDELIGKIRKSLLNVFGNLTLNGPGDPLRNGTFFFEKGIIKNFHFKNLSGGEKAAFDLIVDLIVKQTEFDDTVFCIDEPDLHMHTKLQGQLLNEMFSLVPSNSQLFISTHSIGMIKKAVELQRINPNEVCFIDFHEQDFDQSVIIKPVEVTRELWQKTLAVALDDMAELVVPRKIVICEGHPLNTNSKNKEFDAQCLRKIFNVEHSDTDFISVGGNNNIIHDKLDFVTAMKAITKGIQFIKLVDLDDRSTEEIQELNSKGIKVLMKRDLENYLLDDSIIKKLCSSLEKEDKIEDCLAAKQSAINESISRGNSTDDVKSASGKIYTEIKSILELTQCGNNTEAFLKSTIVPLVTKETEVYNELKKIIFE